jgi:hypothetical protein
MREHIPTLFMRGGALMRHFVHFSHELARMIELGLLRFQRTPRLLAQDVSAAASSVEEEERSDNASELSGADVKEDSVAVVEESKRVEGFAPQIGSARAGGPESLADARLIVSVHIPKTGGTTFLDILKSMADEILYLDYGKGIPPTNVFRKGELSSEDFESFPDLESYPGRSVIHGHFRFGKYANQFPRAVYITWLRDPVERLASHYYYWQRTPFMEDELCNQVISEKMTLEDFAQLDIARNVQHRFLSPGGVEAFDFIGITEEYERSLELFRRLVAPNLTITAKAQNTNPDRQKGYYQLSPQVRQRILALNELDSSTYVDGLRRFRQLCHQVGI